MDLDGKGGGAVLVLGDLVVLHHGGVDQVAALFGGDYGLQAVDQAGHVIIGSSGAGGAEGGVAELAAQVGGVAQDEGTVVLLAGPVDQGGSRAPERVGGVGVNALDGGVVHVVVLVGVQGDLRQQMVPAGDVVLPPLGVDLVLGGEVGALGGGVVHHGHGQEVQTQLILLAVDGQVSQSGGRILSDVGNAGGLAELIVQRGIIRAVFLPVEELDGRGDILVLNFFRRLSLGLGSRFGLGSGRGLGGSGLGGLGRAAAGSQPDHHGQSQYQSQDLFQGLAHVFSSLLIFQHFAFLLIAHGE